MDRTTQLPRSPRTPVLIVSHGDGYCEVFGERHVDVHIARVPVAYSRESEQTADDVVELLLPMRYRSLFHRDRLRAVGSTRALLPTVLRRATATRELIDALNATTAPAVEVVEWS